MRVSDGAQGRITNNFESKPSDPALATHTIGAPPPRPYAVGDAVYIAPEQAITAGDYDLRPRPAVALGVLDSADRDDAIGYMVVANQSVAPSALTDFPPIWGLSSSDPSNATQFAQAVYAAYWPAIKSSRG